VLAGIVAIRYGTPGGAWNGIAIAVRSRLFGARVRRRRDAVFAAILSKV
jgi:hypothetical protein